NKTQHKKSNPLPNQKTRLHLRKSKGPKSPNRWPKVKLSSPSRHHFRSLPPKRSRLSPWKQNRRKPPNPNPLQPPRPGSKAAAVKLARVIFLAKATWQLCRDLGPRVAAEALPVLVWVENRVPPAFPRNR